MRFVSTQDSKIAQRRPCCIRRIGTKGSFFDCQSPPEKRLGIDIAPLPSIKLSKIAQGRRNVRMIVTERFLV